MTAPDSPSLAQRVLQDLDEAERAGALPAALRDALAQLAAGMIAGRVIAGAEATAVMGALLVHVQLAAHRGPPWRGLRLLDELAARGWRQLEHLRADLERAARARCPAPPPATWPEIAALRGLAQTAPASCTIGPPIADAVFGAVLAEGGAALPAELLALYAAADGLTLRHPATGQIVLELVPSRELRRAPDDADDGVLIARWHEPPGRRLTTIIVGHRGGPVMAGALEGVDAAWARGRRALDLPALLRFALARAAAPATDREREAGIVRALTCELSWAYFFAAPPDRVELLVSGGRLDEARALCEAAAAELAEEAASCLRAGEGGAASAAERARDAWLARARALPGAEAHPAGPSPDHA